MSRLVSQIFNQNNSQSIYETIRNNDAAAAETDSDLDDIEERAGMQPIMRQGNRRIEDSMYDSEIADSQIPLRHRSPMASSSVFAPSSERPNRFFPALSGPGKNRYAPRRDPYHDEDDGVDVPQSLLFEAASARNKQPTFAAPDESILEPSASITGEPGPSTVHNRGLTDPWNTGPSHAGFQQNPARPEPSVSPPRMTLIGSKEKAMWKWANVSNLDNFLHDVYSYYVGKGIFNILLNRVLGLLTLVFVMCFGSFLLFCIDYSAIHTETGNSLIKVMKPHCMTEMSTGWTLIQWLLAFFCVYKLINCALDIPRLLDMYNFYTHLLGIPDDDIQTISWQDVVQRIMVLRDANPNTAENLKNRSRSWNNNSKQRMDAHDIANRLMRRENYLIAMFNKEILDLTVPLPLLRSRKRILTRTLEWNLSQCILDFAFNEDGQVRPLFLKDTHRRQLSDGLRKRFIFAGYMNAIFAPFMASYFLVLWLFQNLHDFIKNPGRLGQRQYTPWAEWQFREYNELWHLFQIRINLSYPHAEAYVDQFPKEKTAQLAKFVAFVVGAVLGVLVLGSAIDYELTKDFKIIGELNAVSLAVILGTVVTIARGMIPEESAVYDPEWTITNVIQHTHYMPKNWEGKLHSDDVKKEFMQLYSTKVAIFLEEILSVIFTPLILWYSLPQCSDKIIDFFREFTLHIDGVGYVCTSAHFDFEKTGHKSGDPREEYFASKDNKMLTSYLGFMDQYHTNNKHGRRQQTTHPYQQTAYNEHLSQPYQNTHNKNLPQNHRPPQDQRLVQSIYREPAAKVQGSMMQSILREQPSIQAHHNAMRGSLLDHRHIPKNRQQTLREEDSDSGSDNNLGGSFVHDPDMCEVAQPTVAQQQPDICVLEELNKYFGAHNEGPRPGGTVV